VLKLVTELQQQVIFKVNIENCCAFWHANLSCGTV